MPSGLKNLKKKKLFSSEIMTNTVQFYTRQKCRHFLSHSLTEERRNLVYLHCLSKTKGSIIPELHCSTSFTPICILKRKWKNIQDQFTISNSLLGLTQILLSLRWRKQHDSQPWTLLSFPLVTKSTEPCSIFKGPEGILWKANTITNLVFLHRRENYRNFTCTVKSKLNVFF